MPRLDPRAYQIAILASLLVAGVAWLDFDLTLAQIAVTVGTALVVQAAGARLAHLPASNWPSAFISSLSLCLLLRTTDLRLAAAASAIAIGSKFLVRVRGKHVFNPTNLALVVMLATADRAWVSPGQWGDAAFAAFLIACLGTVVATRAERADVSFAFLAAYVGLMVARTLWLGDPMRIPLHRLQNGALLLFTFFMISDPKTTPDSRAGRLIYAASIALGAYYVHFVLFRTNGLLWSLAACSLLVPVLDRVLPGPRYAWPTSSRLRRPGFQGLPAAPAWRTDMRRSLTALLIIGLALSCTETIRAFCGFYVAKADTKLFNKASQVVLVRDGDRTVLTMANDFKGDPKEFAVVVPVPTFLEKGQIHVGDKSVLDHLDAYSAPRLVEYFDENPCDRRIYEERAMSAAAPAAGAGAGRARADALGVKIEASYTVGEYDILILSATQSTGLETWLKENGYRVPPGASEVLGSYIRQNMRFFVAKVNLAEQSKLGYSSLRPIQVAYESPKFMLPIRLGMVNADGPQELFVFALTRKGRVETTNYRTVKLPTGMDVPLFVKTDFAPFYKAMFAEQAKREDLRAVFMEYAWDMNWCDPCAADPLSRDELKKLGVFWLDEGPSPGPMPMAQRPPRSVPPPFRPTGQLEVFLTRLHVRYDAAHFPEDLVFQETGDRTNFQGRYVLRHAWTGGDSCEAATQYRSALPARYEKEAQLVATLTGWDIAEVRKKMGAPPAASKPPVEKGWWEKLWDKGQ